MAKYRMDVERNFTHEQWIKKTLLKKGLMPLRNLFAHKKQNTLAEDARSGNAG
jgi:hypothetical protein